MTDNACPQFTTCVHAAANFQVLTSGCHDLLELLWVSGLHPFWGVGWLEGPWA